jgi:hypothetical protein
MVAIAFRGLDGARSFGQPTLGRTTAPQGFPLSDGAILGMSVTYFADRSGRTYTDRVVPDKRIVAHDSPGYRTREVPQVAIDWLLAEPACAAAPRGFGGKTGASAPPAASRRDSLALLVSRIAAPPVNIRTARTVNWVRGKAQRRWTMIEIYVAVFLIGISLGSWGTLMLGWPWARHGPS